MDIFGSDMREVLDTFRMTAELGPRALGAYIISMASSPSDVLAVVLLQKEARVQIAAERNLCAPAPHASLPGALRHPLTAAPAQKPVDGRHAARGAALRDAQRPAGRPRVHGRPVQ